VDIHIDVVLLSIEVTHQGIGGVNRRGKHDMGIIMPIDATWVQDEGTRRASEKVLITTFSPKSEAS
jgi:hypothetical protein